MRTDDDKDIGFWLMNEKAADAELRSAGGWARRQLEADAHAEVAIVCSTLERDAARAARLVREGFAASWQHGGRLHGAAAYCL